tara:strand:+ start:489 stop:665 length:177 start_codon:yes stop_codon:yes gene_type:complete
MSAPIATERLLGHTAQTVMVVLVCLALVLLLQPLVLTTAVMEEEVVVDLLRSRTVPAG